MMVWNYVEPSLQRLSLGELCWPTVDREESQPYRTAKSNRHPLTIINGLG